MITFSGENAVLATKPEPLAVDKHLAIGVAQRDSAAIHTFLVRFRPAVFRYLWQASGSREDAEDLAGQALLIAARDIKHYRHEGPLQAWVFRVAQRELLRYRRRQHLAKLFRQRKPSPQPKSEPEDYVVVSDALAKISPCQRAAFLLTEIEGLSIEEAAAVLHVPAGTVKSRCFYARQRLRSLLATTYQEIPK